MLQYDYDPKHKSKLESDFLKKNNIASLEWASYSPDLNQIENILNIMASKINEQDVGT